MGGKAAEPVEEGMKPVYSLPIFDTIKAAQLQNGLRHGDFQRYRQYCGRRLRRLRKATKFTMGRGKQFVNKQVTVDTIKNERHLLIPLYNAERAWGYAMQLREDEKNEKEEKGDEASTRIKFHLIKRLQKAVHWSNQLLEICAEFGDARTSLEAEAYSSYMAGNLHLYREDWTNALMKFSTAERIFSQLSKVGSLEQKDVLQSMLEEINPYIRYSKYNVDMLDDSSMQDASESISDLGDVGNSLLQSKLDAILTENAKKQAESMEEITWRNQSIPIRSEELRVAVIRAQEQNKKLLQLDSKPAGDDAKQESVFLEVLRSYDTALRFVHNEQEKFAQMKSGQLVDAQRDELRQLEMYIRWMKLRQLLDRNMSLLQQYEKRFRATTVDDDSIELDENHSPSGTTQASATQASELIHICDMLLQNVSDLETLPGSADVPDECKEYQSKKLYFSALRSYYIAESYVENKKFVEAVALYEKCSELLIHAEQLNSSRHESASTSAEHANRLEELKKTVNGAKCRVHALGFLHTSTAAADLTAKMENVSVDECSTQSSGLKKRKYLMDRQEIFQSGRKAQAFDLVEVPPSMQAVPCKPMLFDVAFNALSFPDISSRGLSDEERRAKDAAQSSSTSGGFLSWLRGSSN